MKVWQLPIKRLVKLPSPCHIIDLGILEKNLRVLTGVQQKTGCKILLGMKGFAAFCTFPLMRQYLAGVCASGLWEARLGREEFGGEVHTYCPAFSPKDFDEVMKYSDHITFNSFSQWQKFKTRIELARWRGKIVEAGMRINPGYSEVKTKIYNPCVRWSRLGVTLRNFRGQDWAGISGMLFHVMCEQGADTLERVLEVVERKFGQYIGQMRWINFGGGQWITRPGYDVKKLCWLIKDFWRRYPNLEMIYLEPGEAVVLNAGIMVATVLDIVDNGIRTVILDTSAQAHMPDIIDTRNSRAPYVPEVLGAKQLSKKEATAFLKKSRPVKSRRGGYLYQFGGVTCLAGDIIGYYGLPSPLQIGERVIFLDMAQYNLVETNTFNGVKPPAIALYDPQKDELKLVKQFGYGRYRDGLS